MSAVPPLPTVMVIPTGIGCQVGGFAGDGLPSARLLAAASGCLITHPNVMNGAALYWNDPRIQYVEGWALDRFMAAELALEPVRSQRVGVLLDGGMEADLMLRHRQVIEACRSTLGLNLGPVLTTDEPLEVNLSMGSSGSSWGSLGRPETLVAAAMRLKAAGATAIAVVARFPDEPASEELAAYRQGRGVDALAGAEAVISHLVGHHLALPCAHAPALAPLPLDPRLDPRAAAEEIGTTFLACVLVGLSRAPNLWSLAPGRPAPPVEALLGGQIGAVVAPAGALGGEAVLAALDRGVPVIAVEGNPSLLTVNAEALGVPVLQAASYAEAAGWVLALREGIAPEALRRPLRPLG